MFVPLELVAFEVEDDEPSTPAAADICCVEYDPSWFTTTSEEPKEWANACNEAEVGDVDR